MKKPVFVLEISDSSLKLLEGFENEGQVYVIYVKEKPLSGVIENGSIVDKAKLVKEISSLTKFEDPDAKISVLVQEVILVLPPNGLVVFNNDKFTTIVSPEGRIDTIDIKNLYALIRKDKFPAELNNDCVDIIPDTFIVDDGKEYITPPIGLVSTGLTMRAKLHTLPIPLIDSYRRAVLEAGLSISRMVVAPFAACELLATQPTTPSAYFLVDIGGEMTTVSLIGDGVLYSSQQFAWGGNSITRHIAHHLSVSMEKAEELKCLYGYDKKQMRFQVPIYTSEEGKVCYASELNDLVKEELETFINHLNTTIDVLLAGYEEEEKDFYRSLPMVLIGGGARLNGLVSYLSPIVSSKNITTPVPTSLGARKPNLYNVLGAVLTNSKYKNIYEDTRPAANPTGTRTSSKGGRNNG
ncbi:MAG: rod shape-determining protein [Coprobacillus sp.]|nr:rod shape-determining protein [Coprobacillus sp.]